MNEDAACGKGCGLEPMGCGSCGEMSGHSHNFADDPDLFDFEDEDWDDDCDEDEDEPYEMSDVEADADTLASAGWGSDEDYGYYGEE